MDSILASLTQEINCPNCKKQYENPRSLPCQHTLCNCCLQSLKSTDEYKNSQTANCPVCRYLLKDLDQFQVCKKTELLLQTAEKLRQQEAASVSNAGAFKSSCGSCKKVCNLQHCYHCLKMICKDCQTSHRRLISDELQENIKSAGKRIREYEVQKTSTDVEVNRNKEKISEVFNKFHKELNDLEEKLYQELLSKNKNDSHMKDLEVMYNSCKAVIEGSQGQNHNEKSVLSMVETNSALKCLLQDFDKLNWEMQTEKSLRGFSSRRSDELVDENVAKLQIILEEVRAFKIETEQENIEVAADTETLSKKQQCRTLKYFNTFLEASQTAMLDRDLIVKPYSISIDNIDQVYVITDTKNKGNQMYKFKLSGELVKHVNLRTPQGAFNPYQCHYNKKLRRLIVTDYVNNRLAVFDDRNNCVKVVGPKARPSVTLDKPTAITSDNENVYLATKTFIGVLDFDLYVERRRQLPCGIVRKLEVTETKLFVAAQTHQTTDILVLGKTSLETECTLVSTSTNAQAIRKHPSRDLLVILCSEFHGNSGEIIMYDTQTLTKTRSIKSSSLDITCPRDLVFIDKNRVLIVDSRKSITIANFIENNV